ncbi:hypothetical protein ACT6QG_05520 [Xanthobacter sp. TB0136]|uniref:hypothetical protein n=1 Tax=Xanthobacter sp. TB0136 TaxID=3459177 RepID=UPI00403907C5
MTDMTEADRKAFEDLWADHPHEALHHPKDHTGIGFEWGLAHARAQESEEIARLRKHVGNLLMIVSGVPMTGIQASKIESEARAALAASHAPAMGNPITEQNQSVATIKPKVKALVWVNDPPYAAVIATCAVGRYEISLNTLGSPILNHISYETSFIAAGTIEELKAAAQADCERRILSDIEGGEDE